MRFVTSEQLAKEPKPLEVRITQDADEVNVLVGIIVVAWFDKGGYLRIREDKLRELGIGLRVAGERGEMLYELR